MPSINHHTMGESQESLHTVEEATSIRNETRDNERFRGSNSMQKPARPVVKKMNSM